MPVEHETNCIFIHFQNVHILEHYNKTSISVNNEGLGNAYILFLITD